MSVPQCPPPPPTPTARTKKSAKVAVPVVLPYLTLSGNVKADTKFEAMVPLTRALLNEQIEIVEPPLVECAACVKTRAKAKAKAKAKAEALDDDDDGAAVAKVKVPAAFAWAKHIYK